MITKNINLAKPSKNIVIGFYFHPEVYPPTLNAIRELADCYDHITIVHRNHRISDWTYPANVTLVPSGALVSSEAQQQAHIVRKINFFIEFVSTFLKEVRKSKPVLVLVYDIMSLYAYSIVRRFVSFSHLSWYHNHDVFELNAIRKYSISWFASRAESKAFEYLDIFSLPATDRRKYFPMEKFKGKFFFIPNYPSKYFYNAFYSPRKIGGTIRLVYQGQVAERRGIAETIALLRETVSGLSLELALLGPCQQEFKNELLGLAKQHGVLDKLTFGSYSYARLPAVTSTYHIGLGILADNTIMHATVGTASNKLYEYAALGLPVIYYDSENLVRFLGKYSWAVPAALDPASIRQAIQTIVSNYEKLSAAAHADFNGQLNFESGFSEVKSFLLLNA